MNKEDTAKQRHHETEHENELVLPPTRHRSISEEKGRHFTWFYRTRMFHFDGTHAAGSLFEIADSAVVRHLCSLPSLFVACERR